MASVLQVEEIRGPVSGSNANKIIIPSGQTLDVSAGTLNGVTVNSSDLPAGSVVQVKSVVLTTPASATGTTDTGIGANLGLTLSITPKRSNSHFYITVDIGIGSTASGNTWFGILSRDGSKIGNGITWNNWPGVWFRGIDHAGNNGTDTNHGLGASASHYDTTGSTAGSPITFMCGFGAENGSVQINYVESNYSGTAYGVHSATNSTFTVMEIAQ